MTKRATRTTRPGEADYLKAYDPTASPPFALTVDLTIFTIQGGVLTALLVERGDHPYKGFWALPGGHVVHGKENAETAAVRELAEETGLNWAATGGHLEQLATYSDPDRDPRIKAGLHVASVAYVAFAPHLPDPQAGSDATSARYWPIDDLDIEAQADAWHARTPYTGDAPTLGYDHAVILRDGLERVRAKLEYTTLAAQFVHEPFSLGDLRRVYEAAWGQAPELGNFRRKVLSTDGFVVPVERADRPATVAGGRPPLLYRRGPAQWLVPPMMRQSSLED
jgi:8-oxo-dGTP diphosphatase